MQNKIIVILGPTASGKSSEAKFTLATKCIKDHLCHHPSNTLWVEFYSAFQMP